MNKELLRKVANAIRTESIGITFDMGEWGEAPNNIDIWGGGEKSERDEKKLKAKEKVFDEKLKTFHCGTSACVAGFAVAVADPQNFVDYLVGLKEFNMDDVAEEILEISRSDAHRLFYAEGVGVTTLQDYYRKYVPEALEWMADNDTISWPDALQALGAIDSATYKTMKEDEGYCI